MSCQEPIAWETLVAYWSGDLAPDEEEPVELHLLSCEVCTAELSRVSTIVAGIRRQPAVEAPRLAVIQGDRQGSPAPPRRRRWLAGAAGGVVLAAAAAVALLVLPRGVIDATYTLPAPVRDAIAVEIAPAPAVKTVRLVPAVTGPTAPNAARLRRLDGGWLGLRVEPGPPFSVVVPRGDLGAGRYELELLSAGPEGRETSLGFYRFSVAD